MKIINYNDYVINNSNNANQIFENLSTIIIDYSLISESKTVSDFADKFANIFKTVEKGGKAGQEIGELLKGIQSKGLGKTASDIKNSVMNFFSGGKRNILSVDEFERVLKIFEEILEKSDFSFRINLQAQLEELDGLFRKYAKDNNINSYPSTTEFKKYFKETHKEKQETKSSNKYDDFNV